MNELGYLMVAGYRIPIVHMELTQGKLRIYAQLRGPLPAVETDTLTVFGSDGIGCWQATNHQINWPRLGRGDGLIFTYVTRVTGVQPEVAMS